MKNLLLLLTALFSATASAVSLYLNTHGEECYADGTPAMVGECVALVWQRNGTAFPGFTADGDFIGGEDSNTFLVGYCTNVVNDTDDWLAVRISTTTKPFVINDDGGWFSFGKFSAYLLDTRMTSEGGQTVCGFDPSRQDEAKKMNLEGIPYRINAWQPVNGLTNLTFTIADVKYGYDLSDPWYDEQWGDPDYVGDEDGYYIGTTASTPSALPTNCPTALVKSLVIEGGEAVVTVTNVAAYVDYNVAESNDVAALAARTDYRRGDLSKVGQSGAAAKDGALTWRLPISGSKGFFKVVRQPIK